MVQDLFRHEAKNQNLYFNITEMKLSVTSLYIISDASKYEIIWTENSNVIDSLISEIEVQYWTLACSHRLKLAHISARHCVELRVTINPYCLNWFC